MARRFLTIFRLKPRPSPGALARDSAPRAYWKEPGFIRGAPIGEASDKRSGGMFATLPDQGRCARGRDVTDACAPALTKRASASIRRSVRPIPGRIYEQSGAKPVLIEGGASDEFTARRINRTLIPRRCLRVTKADAAYRSSRFCELAHMIHDETQFAQFRI
jgi:hypothetical protein